MPTEIDYARLAAYIDGEGHFSIVRVWPNHQRNRQKTLFHFACLEVSNCDVRLVQWLKDIFGGNIYRHKKGWNPKWRPQFKWRINGRAAADLMKECLQYFIIKREQAELIIEFSKTMVGNKKGMGVRLAIGVVEKREEFKAQLMNMTKRGVVNPELVN